jgi:peptide/nickel transport system permease protein
MNEVYLDSGRPSRLPEHSPALRRPSPLLAAQAQFASSRLARLGLGTLAFFSLLAIYADLLASDLPLVCRRDGKLYLFPGVTRPPALLVPRSPSHTPPPGDFAVYALVRHGPKSTDPSVGPLSPPTLRRGHPFGTDSEGRDVFARVVHGSRSTLGFGILTALLFIGVGAFLGATAGFTGGVLDAVLARMVEVVTAIPTLVLGHVVQAIAGSPGEITLLVTIGATRWTEVARIVRAEVLFAKAQDYVLSARALGASPARVLAKHILPNVIVPALAAAPFGIASVLLIEAAFDFLNPETAYGNASWGEILSQARGRPDAYWLLLFPGLALFSSLVALNLVGEALRDGLDPRLKDDERHLGRSNVG